MAPSCWFFLSWWCLPLMLAVAAAEVQGEGCSGSGGRCGNLAISDPFWLVDMDTGRSCGSGSPDFEVGCYNNTPILRGYGLAGFQIASISYEEHILRAIDLGKLDLLNVFNSCDAVPNWNHHGGHGHGVPVNGVTRENSEAGSCLSNLHAVIIRGICGGRSPVATVFQSNLPAIVARSLTVPVSRMLIFRPRHSFIQLMTTDPFQSIPCSAQVFLPRCLQVAGSWCSSGFGGCK
jgi:hypothetical protein